MTILRTTKIKCPHCGKPITIREQSDISPENQEEIFKEADSMFASMNEHFKRIFNPKLWR